MSVSQDTIPGVSRGEIVSSPSGDDDLFVVACESDVVLAKRAAGCLLLPAGGDMVLLSPAFEDTVYILSVLELNQPEMHIHSQHPLYLESRSGIRLQSDGEVTLITPKTLLCASGQMIVRSQTVQFLTEMVQTIATRIMSHCRNALRVVEEAEDVEAGTISMESKGVMTCRAKVTRILAKDVAKMDGDQVQLG